MKSVTCTLKNFEYIGLTLSSVRKLNFPCFLTNGNYNPINLIIVDNWDKKGHLIN